MPLLPPALASFIRHVAQAGFEVWLIGSRANGTAREDSDWDFLIFGNSALLSQLESEQAPENADVLVVHDGDAFRSPWNKTEDGVIKSGSLTGWKWSKTSESEALYSGTKWPHDWGSTKCAHRIAS